MTKVIIERRLTDNNFIKKYVYGFEKFASSLNMTTAEAEKITGIPAAAIEELAILAGKTERVTIVPGFGLQMYTNGGQTIRSILTIPVITGKIGLPGCSFSFANLQSYVFDETKEPLSYYLDDERDKPFRRALSIATFGKDFLSLKDPGIKVAWIERGNPVTQLPGSDVIKAFKTIPFKVVVDQFMTDSASMADIVLPAKGMFEQADVISSYWNPYVQYKPAVIDFPGEVMPESEIYFRLAGKMGMDVSGAGGMPAPEEYDRWLADRIGHTCGLSISRLKEAPLIPDQSEEIAYSNRKFSTASGKIELWSDSAFKLWGVDPLPSYDPPASFNEEHLPFRLMTPCIASRIHSQFGNLEVIRSVTDEPAWDISVTDARKLGLKSGDLIRVFNSNGEVRGRVRVTTRVRKGSIVFPNGVWHSEGGV
jgi:anaerobic selenocysteine-containing dehydrogenase